MKWSEGFGAHTGRSGLHNLFQKNTAEILKI